MKNLYKPALLLVFPLLINVAQASNQTLASTLEIYVFPTEGQASEQQSMDEAECYDWAVDNTGSDPFELQKQAEQQAQQTEQQVEQASSSTRGAGARGALKGAAAGALIGEVTGGDAGERAGYGAAAGLVMGRRRSRSASQEAQHQAQKQGAAQQQASADQIDNFKKAFSVCLEAHDYMVKF